MCGYLWYQRWISLSVDIGWLFTAETEGGKGSSHAFSAKRGKSKWCRSSIYRNEAQQYQGMVDLFLLNTRGWSSISSVYREWASTSAGWPRSSTSSRRGFIINSLCSYQVTVVYIKEKLIHASGLGVESASLAGILQRSDSLAICRIGAWASSIHAVVMVLADESLQYVLSPGCLPP